MNASLHRRFAPLLVAVVVAGSWVLGARARSGERKDAVAAERPLRVEQVVPLSSQPHEADPSVIWYDSFDGEPRAYAEGDLPQIATERLGDQGGSREMRYRKGTVGAGGLKLFFGDSPTYAAQTVRRGEVFDDVYWRVYVKHAADWQGGGPAKLSRATSLVPPGWRQAMIAHVWSSGDALTLDPASGVRDGEVVTRKYNDFERLRWLGNKPVSPIRVHSSDEAGRWVCIESRAKLNTPGESDGLNQLWIDGQLQCERRDLDWRGTYADHGINAVFLEGYWNAGSPVDQSRWLDGFVVSTAPIGPVVCARRPILCMASPEGRTGDVVAEIAPVGDEERVLWRSTPFPATTPRIEVNAETGRFAKSVRDARLPAEATLHVRLRAADDDEYGPWHQAFRTAR